MPKTSARRSAICAMTRCRRLGSSLIACPPAASAPLTTATAPLLHQPDVDVLVGDVAVGIERDGAGDALERLRHRAHARPAPAEWPPGSVPARAITSRSR